MCCRKRNPLKRCCLKTINRSHLILYSSEQNMGLKWGKNDLSVTPTAIIYPPSGAFPRVYARDSLKSHSNRMNGLRADRQTDIVLYRYRPGECTRHLQVKCIHTYVLNNTGTVDVSFSGKTENWLFKYYLKWSCGQWSCKKSSYSSG